jgi:4-amino-4-deoxy-L-arabinose transferase-like glycosyltransferase
MTPQRNSATVEQWMPDPLTAGQRLIALAIVVVYLSITLALVFTAAPLSDEAGYANPGYNLLHSGKMGLTLFALPDYLPVSTAQRIYAQTPLYFVVTAAFFRIVGFGLTQVRLFSVFWGLVTLFAWFTIVRSLTKSAAPALLVMGLISVDYFFLFGASHGRMEIMCVGLGSAGLAMYMHWRRTHLLRAAFWGNMLAGLAVLTHPASLVWVVGMLLAMLMLDWRSLSVKLLAMGALPYLIAGVAWGSYISQDPAAFREQMKGVLILNERSFDYSHLSHSRVIRYLQQELITRYAGPYGLLPGVGLPSRLKILVLTAYLAGVFGILLVGKLRKRPTMVWFSVLFLAAFFTLAEASPSKYNYYLPHTTVMLAGCLGVFLFFVSESPRWKPILAVVMLVAAIQVAGAVRLIRQDDYHRTYGPLIEAIKQNSPRDALVMSQGEVWFGLLPDRSVLIDNRLGFSSGLRPDVVVMDQVFRDLIERDRTTDPAAYRHEQEMIGQFRSVYKDANCEVYVLARPAPPAVR